MQALSTPGDGYVMEYMHLVPRLARRMKRSLHRADVEELIGAGYLALVKAARAYRGENGCRFSTYLFQCARGEMLRAHARPDGHHDHWRQQWVGLDAAKGACSRAPSPFEGTARREGERRVERALLALRPYHREVLRLTYFEEMETPEIAGRLGLDLDVARRTLRSARRACRRALEGKEPYPGKGNWGHPAR